MLGRPANAEFWVSGPEFWVQLAKAGRRLNPEFWAENPDQK
jgi:hypothetical protein